MKRTQFNHPELRRLQLTPLCRAVKQGLAYGSLVAVSSAMISTPVMAQDDAGGLALEEVIVTAQKRAENLQDVPISIAVLNADALSNMGIVSFDYLLSILAIICYL